MFGNTEAVDSHIPDGIITAARSSGQLDISRRGLTSIPDSVWNINLDAGKGQHVDLSGGKRGENWWDQQDLSKLVAQSNQLSAVGPEIDSLPSLQLLDLHDNQIASISPSIAGCRILQRMFLGKSRLQVPPTSPTTSVYVNKWTLMGEVPPSAFLPIR